MQTVMSNAEHPNQILRSVASDLEHRYLQRRLFSLFYSLLESPGKTQLQLIRLLKLSREC